MSDQELDDLFKEASGSQNTPYDASDWQKMEVLLDGTSAIRSPFWNWKRYTWAAVLFISSVTLVELWSARSNDLVITTTNFTTKESVAALSSEKKSSVDVKAEDKSEQAETHVDQKKASVTEKKLFTAQQKDKTETNVTLQRDKSPIEKREIDDDRIKVNPIVTHSGFEEKVDQKNVKMTLDEPMASESKEEKTEIQTAVGLISDEETAQKDSASNPVLDEAIASDSVKEELSYKKDKQVENNRSFSLKLALSPDFSSVGYFTPGKTGFNYGLIAEYAFSKHISVSLGGIWSKKLYTYKSIESSYGTTVLNGKTIDGDCRILDVPLNVNYYFNPGQRFTLYGSLGLSSYIMFSEDYKYDVIKNGNSYDYTTHVDRKNNEWFKMTNISLGLQYRLKQQWALQVEPFVKAPLSGIGEGDYKLVSSGVFLNVKYTFK